LHDDDINYVIIYLKVVLQQNLFTKIWILGERHEII